MKTIAYNPQREILTALITLILSFSLLTALKAQGNSGPLSLSESKTAMNEEKAPILTNTALTENKTSDNYLAMKIESWMKSGSYWDRTTEQESVVIGLAHNIKRWMSNGSFWSPNSNTETDVDQLALSNKGVITCDALDGVSK